MTSPADLRVRGRQHPGTRSEAVQLHARGAEGSRLREHRVPGRAPEGHADVRRRRRPGQPLQGRRRAGHGRHHVGQQAAEAAARGGGLLARRRHVPRHVALPLRSHGQRQRLRGGDLDRPEGGARLHVGRQAAGHHPARRTTARCGTPRHGSSTTRTSTSSATGPSWSCRRRDIRRATRCSS